MLAAAMLIYGTIGLFRRGIPLTSGQLALCRGVLGSAFLWLYVRSRGGRLRFRADRRKRALLVVSGAAMGLNWVLLFEAYRYTSVAVATLCYYMQPSIVILLSPLVFRERLTPRRLLLAAVAVAGMILVSGAPGGGALGPESGKGVLLGLGAAALYAAVVILNKKATGVESYEKTVIQLLASAAAMIPYLLLKGELKAPSLTPIQGLLVLVVGVLHTGVAYVLYFGSLDRLPAQTAAIYSYIDPITALLLSALVLGERLTLTGLLGAVMILGAAVASEIWKEGEA